ncbi:ribosome small subunit-dependent GTPase A [Acinetobacter qingfengensis]|uniref:Small ribosomal subunit biogenesis GTPase RsgA n=1 Tax=Acinetobacter qingfengensis TaxID=1262585 RepID=A0A1E7RFP3_9GAMM|nr:ribosome small subunit-dependent GTPase A [Acinetobacter qingfengensis]KAA8732699.1 ribosome small subunit-dependent GTPase A [Acinetobacter qingfengensis]OEY98188.1 ribosome small subunit-dependent GTPase A [Acinetobacter qingfengensis]
MALIRKRRLTEQQQRRIEKQQQHRQQEFDTLLDIEGLIVQHYGRQLEVQVCSLPKHMPEKPVAMENEPDAFWRPIQLGEIWRCHTRTNLDALVTGDRVTWQADPNTGLGVITALHPRQSLLSRPDRYHKLKPVAANVDLIVIVFAATPEPSPMLIDRYLVACQTANILPLLVLNKADLIQENDHISILLKEYQSLGYAACITQASTTTNNPHHPQQLMALMQHKTVVFVGQSGVGKSSLINTLIPDAAQKTNIISENSALGQHTTTSTRLIQLNQDTAIIDSPGIREFGLWHLTAQNIYAGFPEFQPFYGLCQFRNCTHQHEKKCALRDAATQGLVLQRRLDSMNRLLSELEDA